jgi:hypothetical protein
MFVPPLVQPIGHRPLEAVDLGFQSGVHRTATPSSCTSKVAFTLIS